MDENKVTVLINDKEVYVSDELKTLILEENTYCCGQIFDDGYQKYILALTDSCQKVCLINLKNGNRYNDPVPVNNFQKISRKEFEIISLGLKGLKKRIKNV
jgi:hypothetical protein